MLLLAVLAAFCIVAPGETRVLDAKSRMILCESAGLAEELIPFDACRNLRMRRQASLQDGRDNHRFTLEVETTDGQSFILADNVTPQVAGQVGVLLALSPVRVAG